MHVYLISISVVYDFNEKNSQDVFCEGNLIINSRIFLYARR